MEFPHCQAVPLAGAAVLPPVLFRREILARVDAGWRMLALFGLPCPGGVGLCCLLGRDADGRLAFLRQVPAESYPSLTPDCPQAHLFEREVHEQWGIVPQGHPWLKPVRFTGCPARPEEPRPAPGVTDHFLLRGEEAHEVAVGPVHAGIIEPGHFRFQCCGEDVYHLEISLGFQHRGIEARLIGGPDKRTVHFMETLAGDATIGHSLAHAALVEALTETAVPARGRAIARIALELERMANHTGDLGAMAGDVGYQPTMAFCGRIRGDFLNLTGLVCGNRFGRGLVRPGGVVFDLDKPTIRELLSRLELTRRAAFGAAELLFLSSTALARFEGTGRVSAETAREIGLVGPPARACGLPRDARHAFPLPGAGPKDIPMQLHDFGGVYARALVRRLEMEASLDYIHDALIGLPEGPVRRAPESGLPGGMVAVGLTEGWRGEICHVAVTGDDGRFAAYKVVDPSFHNWFGLAVALRGQQISDFPLCNKSFNLSYCGHDL